MAKWLIARGQSGGARWHVVNFLGPANCESRGVVDLLAVRKDHGTQGGAVKKGDLFDLVLIQVKGGTAPLPTRGDIARLRKVATYHRAKAVVLCEWRRRKSLELFILRRNRWVPVEPSDVF
jgi:hypothetical protein